MPAYVIVNPAAGRGRAAGLLRQIRESFSSLSDREIALTQTAGDEARLASYAMSQGAHTIVAVGGDGTCTRIANTIIASGNDCRLGVVPCGTGNDFAKTLGVAEYQPEEVATLVSKDVTERIDVGRVDDHYFLNSCGFGFAASVLEATQDVRFLKGNALYIYSALAQLFTYRGIEVTAGGEPATSKSSMLMITVSNGRSLGGVFKIAPRASVLDGRLDACFFSDSNVVERGKLFVGALRGTHLGMPSVSGASVQRLVLTFASSPSMELDGELRRARSRTVELKCVPRGLSVVAAPGALV